MWRKLLVYGVLCVVVAGGAVAYLAGVQPGDFGAAAPVAGKGIEMPAKAAFLAKDLATLEAPLEAAIDADLSAMADLQGSRRWDRELEPLIPTGPGTVLWKDAFEEYVEYRKRAVEAYRKGTRDPDGAREKAIAFLEAYSHAAAWQRGDFRAIREQGDAAIAAGSKDPLVVAYHTRAKQNLGELKPAESYAIYKKLKGEPRDEAYPPPMLAFLLSAWISDAAQSETLVDAPARIVRQLAYQEAATFLAKESGRANPAVLLALVRSSLQFDKHSSDQRSELFQALLAEPRVDPYIHHMIGGEYYTGLAWNYRGSGYASDVTGDGWKKFGELLPRAARHYRRAWYLHPELPYAAQEMILISRAGGDDTWSPEDWFHASLAAQLDHHDAYDSYMFVSMPRWGGSHLKVVNIALECIATGRWDTSVPNEAATGIRLIARDSPYGEFVGRNPDAERIASGYIDAFHAAKERGEAKPEDFASTLAEMTATLVQAENFPQARKGFEIGPESNDRWWGIERGVGYRYSMGLSYAITGPAAEMVTPVHQFLTREAVEAPAVEEVEDMERRLIEARGADPSPGSAGFFDIAGRMLGQLKAYASGEWVDLTFDPQMTLWISRAASYDLIDPKTLRLTATRQTPHMQMKPLTRFAPPYMVEAEIRPVSAVTGEARPGIVIGADHVRGDDEQDAFPQMLCAGKKILAYFEYRQQKGQPSAVDFDPDPLPADGFQHLAIRRYPGETQMYAMHGLMVADGNKEPVNDSILFGEGAGFPGMTGEAVFRNLRIRRAPPKKPGLDTEDPHSLPGFQEAVDYYPECPEARKYLAAALAEQGRAAEALEHIAKAKEVSTKVNDLHRVEGVALCGMGQYAAALSAFQEGTRLFPNSIWGRVHEAWLLATAPDESLRDGRKAQELLQFLRTPLGTRADVWSFLMTEAVVAAENGQFNEAREFARRGDDAADTEFRRSIARRIRQVIDQDRPYRMPETGEIPPPPAFRARSN